ncbi:hypothetical protein [Caudoviricetes sp.]|nr:MAG: hypothetical protein [Podoviridae sp. ct2cs2]UOF77554.1 hypothetical protein [Caudoviricetes sp.]
MLTWQSSKGLMELTPLLNAEVVGHAYTSVILFIVTF